MKDAQKLSEVERKLDGIKMLKINKEDLDCVMTIELFEECCKDHTFMNDDGTGYYATEKEYAMVYASPYQFVIGNIDRSWTHVIWFNK